MPPLIKGFPSTHPTSYINKIVFHKTTLTTLAGLSSKYITSSVFKSSPAKTFIASIRDSIVLRPIRKIVLSKGMVGMDVVEVSPVYDQPGDITAQAAHRCVYEAISALAKIKSMKNEV